MKKHYFLICGLIAFAALAAGMVLYPQLPPRVPSNWDIHNQVLAYIPRQAAVIFFPAMMGGTIVLFAALPALSPRQFQVDSFRSTYLYLMVLFVAAMAYFHGILLWAALSSKAAVNRAVIGGMCLLLALMGNVLGKVRRNFYSAYAHHGPWPASRYGTPHTAWPPRWRSWWACWAYSWLPGFPTLCR